MDESIPLPDVENITDGVEIVENVHDQPAVDTLEGRIGLLLQGKDMQSHFIEMPAGLYTAEHAHETESIIMTLRGEWVLCARGERRHMTTGDIFWFGPDVPTGYEVPFNDSAFILIFKGQRTDQSPTEFVEYLRDEVNPLLEAEREEGEPFWFTDLPDDHPAKEFAASLDAPHV